MGIHGELTVEYGEGMRDNDENDGWMSRSEVSIYLKRDPDDWLWFDDSTCLRGARRETAGMDAGIYHLGWILWNAFPFSASLHCFGRFRDFDRCTVCDIDWAAKIQNPGYGSQVHRMAEVCTQDRYSPTQDIPHS